MRHFDFLTDDERTRLFLQAPQHFGPGDEVRRLAVGLGATLYSPATRPQLARDIARRASEGVMSSVVCLEDAIADEDVAIGEANAIAQLRAYGATGATKPLLFVRVRAAEQIPKIVTGLGEYLPILTGFVLPKFTDANGAVYLDAINDCAVDTGQRLLAMPVLESPELVYTETRSGQLLAIRDLLEKYRDTVLAVRLGATDVSAAYGLRRARDLTVYDVRILADVISDVVNLLGRADGSGHVVTGPVWEYFGDTERMFKPQLRETPFVEDADREMRAQLIAHHLDGLIREIALDKANGLIGKTVIHPTHVAVVHALSVVTHEEYSDATDVLATSAGGGVAASTYGNKMNESKPHTAWAGKVMDRAYVFGVANEATSFVDLLSAGLHQ